MRLFKLMIIGMCAVVMFAGMAIADNSPADSGGVSIQAAGSCTAPCVLGPEFNAVGQTAEYSITGFSGPLTVKAEDGCLTGDTYELRVKKLLGRPVTATSTGSQTAGCICTYSSIVVDDISVTAGGFGTAKARLKALTLPGGVPATAYISFDKGSVAQTAGEDSCL